MFTRQQTLDMCMGHMRKQGKRSVGDDGLCKYRGLYGMKCVAGFLIPDEDYYPGMEGKDARSLSDLFTRLGHDIDLVMSLQFVHDAPYAPYGSIEGWEIGFQNIANRYGLVYTPPDKEVNQ